MSNNVMTPELVYALVANNPNLKNLVEQSARLVQMQQQAQQIAPVLNQFAQNPASAVNGYMNWQQGQQPQQSPIQSQQAPVPQQAQPMNYAEIAQKAYTDLVANLETINGNVKGLYDEVEKNTKRLDDFLKQFEGNSETAKPAAS